MKLHCQRCKQPIASFKQAKIPMTAEHFEPVSDGYPMPFTDNQIWWEWECWRCSSEEAPISPFGNLQRSEDGKEWVHPKQLYIGDEGNKEMFYKIGSEEFVCEPCGFKTNTKIAYLGHCRSKAHKGRVGDE